MMLFHLHRPTSIRKGKMTCLPQWTVQSSNNMNNLLKSANQELYPGCESFSVLTAIVELMHGKIKYHGEAWKEFDRTFPDFAADPRNVRLGLATDGFNPYGDPGRSIDVYLRPLVDELKDLWTNGVRTYDKATGKMFTLRAAVMWTVNDFPAYAMVSGWLSWDHEWREKDKEFDGNTEHRLRPREWSGDEILEQLNRLDFSPFGKTVTRMRPATHLNWTHKSMFFELPYWSKLKLRHNLDVMHVEKNVFDTLVGTILDIEGKTKDTIKARLDLERMGIRRGLWMNRDGDKARRDLAFFAMKPNDKKDFLRFVSSVKFPDGYASNVARCVNVDGGKFTGLKSHDCHVFMQRLLPVGIRHLLPEDVVKPIMLLSRFFAQLTAKTLRKTDINQLRNDIVQVLCKFEMIFPPAFFTSMIHVMVHLPEEALLAGPVNYRWMYPIESGWKVAQQMDQRNVYAIPELDPTDNDIDNVTDQRLDSSMENRCRNTSRYDVIQEPASSATGPDRKEPGSCPLPSPASSRHELLSSRRNLQKNEPEFPKMETARSLSFLHQIGRVRYGFLAIFHELADGWVPQQSPFCHEHVGFDGLWIGVPDTPKSQTLDLIRRRRSVTTTPSPEPRLGQASAATAPKIDGRTPGGVPDAGVIAFIGGAPR
ncbi:unnamed protein product [Prunus brigantina]